MGSPVIFSGSNAKLLASGGLLTAAGHLVKNDGDINYFPNNMFVTDPTSGIVTTLTATGNRTTNTNKWGASTTSLASWNSSSPLRGAKDLLLTLTGASAAQFVESPLFSIDSVQAGLPVQFAYDYKAGATFASGDIDFVVIRYNSSGTYQETISPQVTPIGPGTKPENAGFFVSSSTTTDLYALRWRSQNASARTLQIQNVFVGKQGVYVGQAVSDWQSYTPTITGLGTTSNVQAYWKRVGDSIHIQGRATSGTSTAVELQIGLPSGVTSADTNYIPQARKCGSVVKNEASSSFANHLFIEPSKTYAVVTSQGNGTNGFTKVNGSDFLTTGNTMGWYGEIPVSGWSSNIQVADRAVEEFAYNTDVTSTASVTASGFANGSQGVNFSSNFTVGTAYTRRVRFQTAGQPTDYHVIEVQDAGVGPWVPVGFCNAVVLHGVQGTTGYGMWGEQVPGSTTDYDVYFGSGGRVSNNATYGGSGAAFSTITSSKWRVRRVSAGALVGYPVGARNVAGDTTGTSVPTGYIGEKLESKVTSLTTTGLASATFTNITSVTLTAGVWDVTGTIQGSINTATGVSGETQGAVSIHTGNTTTDHELGNNELRTTAVSSTAGASISIPAYRVVVSSTQVVYLKVRFSYTGGVPSYAGRISAVRIG